MFRSLTLALGAYSCLLGMEALFIKQATLKAREGSAEQEVINPPRWAPWSLMAGGAVTILYTFSIPRRMNG